MTNGQRWFEPSDVILLTGAGFTKNFGGYLASEMWAALLNQEEVQHDAVLRKHLLANLNYEMFYDEVQESKLYDDQQRMYLTDALRKAYRELDENLTGLESLPDAALAFSVCRGFIGRFAGEAKKRGFFFTLNQDLFVERFYSNDRTRITVPGLRHPKWFGGLQRGKLEDGYEIPLPDETAVKKLSSQFWGKSVDAFAYIKLHGSFGWRSADGSDAMVVGQGKEGRIQRSLFYNGTGTYSKRF